MLRNRRRVHVGVTQAIAVSILALTWTLAATPASAQSVDTRGTTEVSVPRANFRADCSMSAEVVATLTEGEEVEVLGIAGSWYRVRHTESGIEGCMHQTVLGAVTPLSEEEAEELEEWEEEIREREAEAREAELEAERERREEALEAERERREAELEAREEEAERRAREAEWAARRARGEKRITGYLDLNIGYGIPGEDGLHVEGALFFATNPPTPIPNSHFVDDYEYSGDLSYGVAGGVLVALVRGGSVGGGVSLTRTTYSTDLREEISLPHPTVPGVIVEDSFTTSAPDRTETALHLHAVYAPPTPEQLRVRVFLGPTIFRLELPIAGTISWIFPVNPPRVVIQDVEFGEESETVVGGHVGVDVAYFFSRSVGIGASVNYSRATEEFEFSPLDAPSGEQIVEEVTLGGLSAALGVRFRF